MCCEPPFLQRPLTGLTPSLPHRTRSITPSDLGVQGAGYLLACHSIVCLQQSAEQAVARYAYDVAPFEAARALGSPPHGLSLSRAQARGTASPTVPLSFGQKQERFARPDVPQHRGSPHDASMDQVLLVPTCFVLLPPAVPSLACDEHRAMMMMMTHTRTHARTRTHAHTHTHTHTPVRPLVIVRPL